MSLQYCHRYCHRFCYCDRYCYYYRYCYCYRYCCCYCYGYYSPWLYSCVPPLRDRWLDQPGRGINMGDGWETARKPGRPAVLELDTDGLVKVSASDCDTISVRIR